MKLISETTATIMTGWRLWLKWTSEHLRRAWKTAFEIFAQEARSHKGKYFEKFANSFYSTTWRVPQVRSYPLSHLYMKRGAILQILFFQVLFNADLWSFQKLMFLRVIFSKNRNIFLIFLQGLSWTANSFYNNIKLSFDDILLLLILMVK
jgi:hypothetical protein